MRQWALCLVMFFAGEMSALAQVRLAELSGTVRDESGAVLPGVTVTAEHVENGQVRSTVTEASGAYQFSALQVGLYRIRAELSGFTPVVFTDYRLSLGDTIKLDIHLKVASLEETLTVTAETPIIDTSTSTLSGKITQTQVEELPVNGRNWLNFATLAPGVKSDGGNAPSAGVSTSRMGSKVFVDGASVQTFSTVGIQTEVSKDIIGEFEVLTNRFDAQLGHSGSAVVNAVTKSGTDQFHGSAFFYWRDDSLNATDFFTGQVEPYENRQYGGTMGGPVVRGKTQFFANYERQVEPTTKSANSGIPNLDVAVDATDKRNMAFGRLDHSLTPNHRLSGRLNYYERDSPFQNVGGTVVPSAATNFDITTYRWNFGLHSVFGSKFVNQLLVNYTDSGQFFTRVDCGYAPALSDCPTHTFPAVRVGPQPNVGSENHNWLLMRSDASWFFEKAGRHNMKFGGEVQTGHVLIFFPNATNGVFFYNSNPANLASCCPGADQSQWNTSGFPIPARYQVGLGDFETKAPNDLYGFYVQDDWMLSERLTLNLGLRYDLEVGSLGNDQLGLAVEPGKNDTNNFQPRVGFAWDLAGNGRTVVRGGAGLYYDQVYLNLTYNQLLQNSGQNVSVTVFNTSNDPNFANDPLGGRDYDDLKELGGARNVAVIERDAQQPHTWSASIGIARQLRTTLAVTADYVYQKSDAMLQTIDTNLFCCLADGNAVPVTSGTYPELGGVVTGGGRPDPRFNQINTNTFRGRARYHGLQVGVEKRMSKRYQFGLTYLLSKNEDSGGDATTMAVNNAFNLEDEYGRSNADQLHRFTANWVVRMPWEFNFNGILYAASGQANSTTTGGVDINGDGAAIGDRPICGRDPRFAFACGFLGVPDGERIPRNPYRSDAILRFDLRLSRAFRFVGLTVEPLVEAFNVFNRQNNAPGSYNGTLTNARFGQPGRSAALPYQPRQFQLGVRMYF